MKHLKIEDSNEYFKLLKVGKSVFKRYSAKALDKIKKAQNEVDMGHIYEIFIKVDTMSKELLLYTLYDVLFLKTLPA